MADSSDPRSQDLFGRIAVERGYITTAQLEMILKLRQALGGTHPVGGLLIQRGMLSATQVQEIMAIMRQAEQRAAVAASHPPAPRPVATPVPQPSPQPQVPARPAAPQARPLQPPLAGAPAVAPPIAPPRPAMPAQGQPGLAPARPVGAPNSPAASAHQGGLYIGARGVGGATPPVPPSVAPPQQQYVAPALTSVAEPPPAAPVAKPNMAKLLAPLRPASAKSGRVIAAMIEAAESRGASDIHFHAGTPTVLRIEGRLGVVEEPALDVKEQERELLSILDEQQRRFFEEYGEVDFAYVTPNGLRTRANVYRGHSGTDAVFRVLPRGPQTLEQLGLPSQLAKLVSYHQGLVLVTGPAGSGKSTTLSALVNLINDDRAEHVLLLEDPIEIVHPQKKALINQRQVGRDTESFARALRGALREDPDVIVIGDLRDRETISLAITAAETGHLVIGSMNTNNAARTVGRIIDAFPPVQQSQVRAMISESLRGVVSQKLVMGTDGKRVPAAELLFNTPAMANVIRKGEFFQIRSQMQVGKAAGMRTFDEALREHVLQSRMEAEEARKWADNPAFIPSGPTPPPPPVAAPPKNPGMTVIPSGPAKQGAVPMTERVGAFFGNRSGSRS